jgi:hypothetical protein
VWENVFFAFRLEAVADINFYSISAMKFNFIFNDSWFSSHFHDETDAEIDSINFVMSIQRMAIKKMSRKKPDEGGV